MRRRDEKRKDLGVKIAAFITGMTIGSIILTPLNIAAMDERTHKDLNEIKELLAAKDKSSDSDEK